PFTDRAQVVFDSLATRVPGLNASGRFAQRVRKSLLQTTVRTVLGAPAILNRALSALPDDCLLVMGFEGQPALVAAELLEARAIAVAQGGTDLGPEPGERWFEHRHRAPFRQSPVYAAGLFFDAFEAVATWDRLLPMYRAVKRAIAADAMVMAHFSHAYGTGCAVSFTFAAPGADSRDGSGVARYDRIVGRALRAVHETGGSVAHHLGIGEARGGAMPREHGPGGLRILNALKRSFDPANIMNPGKLGLTEPATVRSLNVARDEEGFAEAVVAAVGERNVTTSGGRVQVRPPDENALAAVLRVAHRRGLTVATDQTGFRAPTRSVQLDLRRFEGISRISEHAHLVEAEAGVIVHRLEALLQEHGLTLGSLHPRSLLRTVGAALSRNLLIRRSIADGDLGGLCLRVRGLLANGTAVETRLVPKMSTGPEVARAFVGGRGRLGIITRAVLRVQRVPRFGADLCYRLPDLEAGLAVARRVLRREIRPAAARIVPDPPALDNQGGSVRFAVRLVAPTDSHLRAQRAIVAAAMRESGAVDLGLVTGLAEGGIFDSVVEAPTTWDQAITAIRAAASSGCRDIWLDFMAVEGLTLVARVPDADTRRTVAGALAALPAPVVAGAPKEQASDYDDVLSATARMLDPSGVFRARTNP
ncbi:MAG: FAD-linked oxidase C-terminal domain-containing protein, partial [Myxococcota bacterium]